jgi:hypothetical protein
MTFNHNTGADRETEQGIREFSILDARFSMGGLRSAAPAQS